eukprot:6558982-Ditylum_brightwellii.AAC.1
MGKEISDSAEEMVEVQKNKTSTDKPANPRIIFCSSALASAVSFEKDAISSLGSDSSEDKGCTA